MRICVLILMLCICSTAWAETWIDVISDTLYSQTFHCREHGEIPSRDVAHFEAGGEQVEFCLRCVIRLIKDEGIEVWRVNER